MPRPRRKSTPKASPRSARTARDNARARALGYKDYYDFRLHDSGRIPAGKAAPPKGERATARGHGLPKGFLRSLGSGDMIILADPISSIELYDGWEWRTVDGRRRRVPVERYRLIRKLVIYAITGRERRWNLRRLTRAELRATIRAEERRGVMFSPAPSRDQRRLIGVDAAGDE